MRRRQQYDLINKCTYETKQAESGTGKQKRMSIESADMEKIEHDRRSKPTEAAAEDRQMGMNMESSAQRVATSVLERDDKERWR